MTTTMKPTPDWELAERLYRTGQLSLRTIAAQVGVTEAAIRKRAKKAGWARDLTEKVRQAVRAKLVRASGTQPPAREGPPRTEREDIEQAAENAVAVVRSHRKDLRDGQQMVADLFAQLREVSAHRQTITELIETQGLPAAIRKAVSLPIHAATLRDLSTALAKFQACERVAWNLDAEKKPDDPFANLTDEQLAAREAALRVELEEAERGG